MTAVYNEYQQWEDEDTGELMVGGQVYIGEQSQDPEVSPKNIYSDRSLTTSIANPQTIQADGRTEYKIWVSEKYSIKVKDINGVVKFTDLDRGQDDNIGNTRLINSLGINDVVVTGSPTVTELTDNQTYIFDAPADNTGAMTLQIDTLPAYSIRKGHDQLMASGDIKQSQRIVVVWNADDSWFEAQSGVLGSTFGGDVTIGGDILDANGNEIISLNETASAVNHLDSQNAATGNGPTLSAAGDDTNIDLNLAGKGTGVAKVGGVDIQAGVHVNSSDGGGYISSTSYDVDANVTEATWETVGPTGSGATHIWTALDSLPTDTDWVEIRMFHQFISTSDTANTQRVAFCSARGNGGAAATGGPTNIFYGITYTSAAGNAGLGGMNFSKVQVDSSNIFEIYWSSSFVTTENISMYLSGYGPNQ